MNTYVFQDRVEAGKALSKKLIAYKGVNAIIFALPRGGVEVGRVIADSLNLPLSIISVRKISHPYDPEYAIGAASSSGEIVIGQIDPAVTKNYFENEAKVQQNEARRRLNAYLFESKKLNARGKTAILVDDGAATGLTILSAIKELRRQKPREIIVAVPVAAQDALNKIHDLKADVFTLLDSANFLGSVGAHYRNFEQLSDEKVIDLLKNHD